MKPEQFEMILEGLPAVSSHGVESDIEAFLAAFDKFGPLILQADAALLLGVTPQRVAQLTAIGHLTQIPGLPRAMVPFSEVMHRRANPPRNGRPRKQVA